MTEYMQMNQVERARFENMIARALQTQRRFIRIDSTTILFDGTMGVRVIYRGGFVYRIITDGVRALSVYREVPVISDRWYHEKNA